MELPSYFLPRPGLEQDAATIAAFEDLFASAVAPGADAVIPYPLAAPKWQFLCHLCETKNIVVHGSGRPDIAEFEPRQSSDVREFGNRRAVYAASDGIWALYFAVLDRERYVTSLVNACLRIVDERGHRGAPAYYFSINADALPHQPWRKGTIYLLPRTTFEQQALQAYRGVSIEVAQWASSVPVRPLARLAVEPEDFPFLAQVQGHDPQVVQQRAAQDPTGFPWLDS